MVKRNTWILLGFFAVLLAAVWAIPRWQSAHDQPSATPSTGSTNLLGSNLGTIKEMKIAGADGNVVVIVPAGNNTWSATAQPDPKVLDANQLQQAVTTIQGLTITTFLPTPPPLDAIGLTNPSHTITIIMDRGPQREIKVGSVTPTGGGYYVQVDDNSPSVVEKSNLDAVLNLLTAPVVSTGTPSAEGTPVPNPSQTP
jgi:hypothetical protein